MKQLLLLFFSLFYVAEAYGIKPDREYFRTPKDLGLNYKEYRIKTADNYVLNSWHIMPQANAAGYTIILSYGDSGNMALSLALAAGLAQKGVDVWLYDYRGFGKSDDFAMNAAQLYYTEFVKDLSAVVDKAKATNPKNKICLFGLSMGTIINTLYYHEHPDKVDLYIGEGLVYSPEAVIARIKATSGKEVLLPQSDIRLEDVYANIKIPFLLLFPSDDIVCNHDDLAALQQKVTNMKVVNYKGGHLEGWWVLGAQPYIQHITDFLQHAK